ncbi:uncharacterized protein LOC132193950 [Neocloeon triangulifer]|uniref:uncharacterized protein LOC132193950 n=1 Tax=Neocloeon triangulifer TaxID=2078957 RepID=UPI00286F9C2B|nr:uncharacterized protein LOC132193950 [Neocloeon triangulifer]
MEKHSDCNKKNERDCKRRKEQELVLGAAGPFGSKWSRRRPTNATPARTRSKKLLESPEQKENGPCGSSESQAQKQQKAHRLYGPKHWKVWYRNLMHASASVCVVRNLAEPKVLLTKGEYIIECTLRSKMFGKTKFRKLLAGKDPSCPEFLPELVKHFEWLQNNPDEVQVNIRKRYEMEKKSARTAEPEILYSGVLPDAELHHQQVQARIKEEEKMDVEEEMDDEEADDKDNDEESEEDKEKEEEATSVEEDDTEEDEEEETIEDIQATVDNEMVEKQAVKVKKEVVEEDSEDPVLIEEYVPRAVKLPEPDLRKREVTKLQKGQYLVSNCGYYKTNDGTWTQVTGRCVYSAVLNMLLMAIRSGHDDWARSLATEESPSSFKHFLALALQGSKVVTTNLHYHSLRLVNQCQGAGSVVVKGEATIGEVLQGLRWFGGTEAAVCHPCKIFTTRTINYVTQEEFQALRAGKVPKASLCLECLGPRESKYQVNELGFPVLWESKRDFVETLCESGEVPQELVISGKVFKLKAMLFMYKIQEGRHCIAILPPLRTRHTSAITWKVADANQSLKIGSLSDLGNPKGRMRCLLFVPCQ